MSDKTAIQWTDATWNPFVGCSIFSPGCRECYAMEEATRQIRCAEGLGRTTHYEGTVKTVKGKAIWTGKVNLAPEHILTKPLSWKRPRRIFVNSMSDLFHESAPDEWIDRVFAVMALCPQHTFQVLTKRAERMLNYFARGARLNQINGQKWSLLGSPVGRKIEHGGKWMSPCLPLPNVWLGVSTERQKEADERIPLLLQTPASVRFISAEPLLGPIEIDCPEIDWMQYPEGCGIKGDGLKIDWVIAGGESGKNARPMHPGWARSLRDQCGAARVPFFFKQWGAYVPCESINISRRHAIFWDSGNIVIERDWPRALDALRVGIPVSARRGKNADRLLDGREHNEFPVAIEEEKAA